MGRIQSQDVDGGYAYAILCGCTLVYMLVVGGAKSYGLLYTELLDYFGSTASATGWSTGINLCLIYAMAPVSNSLAKRYSFRWVTFVGGLLAGGGYVLSAFVPTMEYIYLTFGVITGVGYGLVLPLASTLVSYFFEKHRFLASGITFGCSGIWAISLSFLYDYLVATFGLRGTLLICGGINFNICAAACLFIQPEALSQKKTSSEQSPGFCPWMKSKSRMVFEEIKQHLVLLKIPSFTMFQISLMFMMYSYVGGLTLLAAEVDYRGLAKVHESINIAILGVCDVIARFSLGWFSDLRLIHTRYVYIINLLFGATFTFLVPYVKSLLFLRIWAGSVGLFLASYMALLPPYLIESFGMERFPQGLGLSFVSMSIFLLIGPPILGATADVTGNWDAAFLSCGMVLLAAALTLAVDGFVSRLGNKNTVLQDKPPEYNTKL